MNKVKLLAKNSLKLKGYLSLSWQVNIDNVICRMVVRLPINTAFLSCFPQWSTARVFTFPGSSKHSLSLSLNVLKGLQALSKPIEICAYLMLSPFSSDLVTLGLVRVFILSDETSDTSRGVSCDAQPARTSSINPVIRWFFILSVPVLVFFY